jgi:hypothetical protein
MFKAKIVDTKPHIVILNPFLKIAVSNIPMGKNCGSPPKIAENCGKIAEIAEKLRKLRKNCGNCGKIAENCGNCGKIAEIAEIAENCGNCGNCGKLRRLREKCGPQFPPGYQYRYHKKQCLGLNPNISPWS